MPSLLGEKIRALRKLKKLSLEQLAELTESSKSYLWKLENKDAPKPSVEKLARIAAVLEVTPWISERRTFIVRMVLLEIHR